MTNIIIIAIATLVVVATAVDCIDKHDKARDLCSLNKWNSYKLKFGKNYIANSSEDTERKSIFCKTLNDIAEHNANPDSTFKMGLNSFSDRTAKELSKMLRPKDIESPASSMALLSPAKLSQMINMSAEIPSELDWSKDPKRVSPARNQGDCGSCWTFATIAMLEGQERPSDNETLVELSEQNLLDCDEKNYGCVGGWYPEAFDEIRRFGGLMRRDDYPYMGVKQKCKANATKAFKTTVDLGPTRLLTPGNETLLMQVVATYGPVAVDIHAPDDFYYYRSGIYYNSHCNQPVNHAVVIVGYGTQNGVDYWKVKNSWSTDWGTDGFGLMSRNRKNNCRIASLAYIITPKEESV